MSPRHLFPLVALLAGGSTAGAQQAPPFAGFSEPVFIEVGVNPSHAMPIDANGDGRLDLLVANMGRFALTNLTHFPPSVQVLIAQSDGSFVPDPAQLWGPGFPHFVTQPLQIVTGDVNNDGFLDAVLADDASRGVKTLRFDPVLNRFRDPLASEIMPTDPMLIPGNVRSVDLGDLNGDGLLDAVASPRLPADASFIGRGFGDGQGRFPDTDITLAEAFSEAGDTILFGDFVEFDPDTGQDIPGSGFTGAVLVGGRHPETSVGHGHGQVLIAAADADGNFDENRATGTSAGTFDDIANGIFTARWASLGGDFGRRDLIIPANLPPSFPEQLNGWGIKILLDGRYVAGPDNTGPGGGMPDGEPDFIGFPDTAFFPTAPAPGEPALSPFDAPRPFAVTVGDVNGDGKPDLVITHGGPASPVINDDIDLSIMLNTSTIDPATGEVVDLSFQHTGVIAGDAGAVEPFRFEASISAAGAQSGMDEPRVYPHLVELADLDGDGDLDIITTRSRRAHPSTTDSAGAPCTECDTLPIIPGEPGSDGFDFINADTGVATNDSVVIFYNQSPPACGGADLNGDGVVDGADLTLILNLFGQACQGCPEDLNGDGAIGRADTVAALGRLGDVARGAFVGDAGSSAASTESLMVAEPGGLFGFSSHEAYMTWLGTLSDDQIKTHCLDLIDRLRERSAQE